MAALATMVGRARILPKIAAAAAAISSFSTTTTTNILCRRNQRRPGVTQIQQLDNKSNLIRVVEEEIDKAHAEVPDLCLPDGFPFKIIQQDDPGSSKVVLQRTTTTTSDEVVTIVADMATISTYSPFYFPLVATVTKPNGQQLEFRISIQYYDAADDFRWWLSHVRYSVSPASHDEYLPIPVWGLGDKHFQKDLQDIQINTGITLSGLTQKAFYKYLKAREIKPRTTLWVLFDYMKNRRQRECSTWLNKFNNFVAPN